ncbi:hypothetical protein [Halosimplex sp. J119]
MNRRNTLGTALVVLAIVLFTVPAFFPVQPVLVHDTDRSVNAPPEELRQEGYRIIGYENLSSRGQELYVEALKQRRDYSVPQGQGADEFPYLNQTEIQQVYRNDNRSDLDQVVIKRPADDSGLPPAGEYYHERDPEETNMTEQEREQRRERALRYDAIETTMEQPPLGATPQLLRLAAVLFAVLSLGVGGYLFSSK